jgi:hypothetical protein
MDEKMTTARYEGPTKEYIKQIRKEYDSQLANFATHYEINKNEIKPDKEIIDDVINRVHQRENYYLFFHGKRLTQSRVRAIASYWILKYRPLKSFTWNKDFDINAYFALFCVISQLYSEILGGFHKNVQNTVIRASKNTLEKLYIRPFSEYDISKESLTSISDGIKSTIESELYMFLYKQEKNQNLA